MKTLAWAGAVIIAFIGRTAHPDEKKVPTPGGNHVEHERPCRTITVDLLHDKPPAEVAINLGQLARYLPDGEVHVTCSFDGPNEQEFYVHAVGGGRKSNIGHCLSRSGPRAFDIALSKGQALINYDVAALNKVKPDPGLPWNASYAKRPAEIELCRVNSPDQKERASTVRLIFGDSVFTSILTFAAP